MLRRLLVALAGATIVAVGLHAAPAAADTVICPPDLDYCIVIVKRPGGPGVSPRPSPSRSTAPRCRMPGSDTPVPCYVAGLGWWSNADGCYFQLADPQPPLSDPAWGGRTEGAVYVVSCLGGGGIGGGWVWRAAPPPGFGGAAVTPAQLAAEAIALLPLRGPAIGMAPEPGKTGLVGLPVWMWTAVTPQTWGPVSATASIPGLSVTATARAVRVEWSMGDGTTVTCDTPGTPYTSARGNSDSPDCGHRYTASSAGQPGEAYRVTATTTWRVDWAGGGQSGSLTQTRSSSTTARIGELQVLVR